MIVKRNNYNKLLVVFVNVQNDIITPLKYIREMSLIPNSIDKYRYY